MRKKLGRDPWGYIDSEEWSWLWSVDPLDAALG